MTNGSSPSIHSVHSNHSYNSNSISDNIPSLDNSASFGPELSAHSNFSDYSTSNRSQESISQSHSYNNGGAMSHSHSPQDSENSFIAPLPNNIHNGHNQQNGRSSSKHRPKAPMQVYSPMVRKNKLEKMRTPKISSNFSPNNSNSNIPTNTNVNLRVSISSLRLDALPDDNDNNNNNKSMSPLSPLSEISSLKDEDEEEDENYGVIIPPDTPTRNRAYNLFEQEIEKQKNKINEKPAFTIQVSNEIDGKTDDEDPGESDIPTTNHQMSDWIAASAFCVDPTLDPKKHLKNRLNKNPIKNIRTRSATFIGKTNNDFIGPLSPNQYNKKANALPPSTTSPAFGARLNRADSLSDRFNRFKGVQMNDGNIVLSQQDTHIQLDPDQLMKQFQKGFPDFQDLHQRFALEFCNKIFNGHLKSYQRAFMPITPKHLGLMDFGDKRDS